jgi:hypothetical protein
MFYYVVGNIHSNLPTLSEHAREQLKPWLDNSEPILLRVQEELDVIVGPQKRTGSWLSRKIAAVMTAWDDKQLKECNAKMTLQFASFNAWYAS